MSARIVISVFWNISETLHLLVHLCNSLFEDFRTTESPVFIIIGQVCRLTIIPVLV